MDRPALQQLLAQVRSGACSVEDAVHQLGRLPFVDLGFAKIDHHRVLRQGLPEAVYAPGKTPEHCAAIVAELLSEPGGPVLLTRAEDRQLDAAVASAEKMGASDVVVTLTGDRFTAAWRQRPERPGHVAIVTAGTADLPTAEECRAVLVALGFRPTLITDCGVAGLHRFLSVADRVREADVVVVVAGMEGALASLVGGVVAAPVVAVPTSAGYGTSLDGVTALLAMLSSCAPGITVVGIDNGFGAAYAVARMLR